MWWINESECKVAIVFPSWEKKGDQAGHGYPKQIGHTVHGCWVISFKLSLIDSVLRSHVGMHLHPLEAWIGWLSDTIMHDQIYDCGVSWTAARGGGLRA